MGYVRIAKKRNDLPVSLALDSDHTHFSQYNKQLTQQEE
jgi:hypothetical protein